MQAPIFNINVRIDSSIDSSFRPHQSPNKENVINTKLNHS